MAGLQVRVCSQGACEHKHSSCAHTHGCAVLACTSHTCTMVYPAQAELGPVEPSKGLESSSGGAPKPKPKQTSQGDDDGGLFGSKDDGDDDGDDDDDDDDGLEDAEISMGDEGDTGAKGGAAPAKGAGKSADGDAGVWPEWVGRWGCGVQTLAGACSWGLRPCVGPCSFLDCIPGVSLPCSSFPYSPFFLAQL